MPNKNLSIQEKRELVLREALKGNVMASNAMRVIEYYEDALRKLARLIDSVSFDR